MRCFTIKVYANNEYALSDRLKEIQWDIDRTIWPSACFTKNSRRHKESGYVVQDSEYHLTDYEYEKENPNWRSTWQTQETVGKWQMRIVPDQDYVNFQQTPEL